MKVRNLDAYGSIIEMSMRGYSEEQIAGMLKESFGFKTGLPTTKNILRECEERGSCAKNIKESIVTGKETFLKFWQPYADKIGGPDGKAQIKREPPAETATTTKVDKCFEGGVRTVTKYQTVEVHDGFVMTDEDCRILVDIMTRGLDAMRDDKTVTLGTLAAGIELRRRAIQYANQSK